MTILAPNVPHETDSGFVDVENALPPGRHRFRLTVLDSAKNESEPAFILVTVNEVQRDPRPDPRPDPREPRVVLDRTVIDRVVVNPRVVEVVRPTRPIIPIVPRRPGG
ncbi:MAG TPA: hypothetical protein VFP12_04955 [Allosphingosinicella sp.]|nr:hypothetical protein [Allosphingosinicella sp.]